jgi:hypothetical protein
MGDDTPSLWDRVRSFGERLRTLWDGLARKLSSIPDVVWSLLLLTILLILIVWAAYYYFDLNIILIVGGSVGGVLVVAGFAYGFMPTIKSWLEKAVPALFKSTGFLRFLQVSSAAIFVGGLAVSRVVVEWKGTPTLISIDGASEPQGDWNESSQSISRYDWSIRRFKARPFKLMIGHVYVYETWYRPFLPRRVNIPQYALDSVQADQRQALHLLALTFFDHDADTYLQMQTFAMHTLSWSTALQRAIEATHKVHRKVTPTNIDHQRWLRCSSHASNANWASMQALPPY